LERGDGGWKSPWKKAGKTMEKLWENPGKTRKSEENHGKIMGQSLINGGFDGKMHYKWWIFTPCLMIEE
jgi:hypothetical protein